MIGLFAVLNMFLLFVID